MEREDNKSKHASNGAENALTLAVALTAIVWNAAGFRW